MGEWLGCERGCCFVTAANMLPCRAWVCGRLSIALAIGLQVQAD